MMAMVGQAAESMGRLLVVEGDLVQRTVIGRIGEKLGYDILIASCFEAAARLRAMDILVRLRIKNIGAAIDDFGTGHSSLSPWRGFPSVNSRLTSPLSRAAKPIQT
jgi:hypothetical protein